MIAFLVRRSRWMILGWAARRAGRVGLNKAVNKAIDNTGNGSVSKSVDKATAVIEERLPAPVAKAVQKLPGDLARAGGAVVVAGHAAQSASASVRSAGESGRRISQKVRGRSGQAKISDRVHQLRDEIAIESDDARRRIHSDMLRETEGEGAALDALLDLRPTEIRPLPEIPAEIASGRRRHRQALPTPPVNRMSRTYRKKTKAWDRPLRRR